MTTPATPSLDLKEIRISPLQDSFNLKQFKCGEQSIDKWVTGKAAKHHERYRVRVFCAHKEGGTSAFGLYSLSMSSEDISLLRDEDKRHYINTTHFPAVYIRALCVLEHYQSSGLGTVLLMNALRRAHFISQHVAIYGVALRSLNERTTKLYERYGFKSKQSEEKHPLMVLPIWSLDDIFKSR